MTPPKNLRRYRVRPRREDIDTVVIGQQPLAQVTIYDDLVLLTRDDGSGWRSYPVSPDALAQVFSNAPNVFGILPENTLGCGTINGVRFYAVYVPPQRVTLKTTQRDYDLPLPPLVWAGWGRDYRIFALAEAGYPTREVALYHAPFPNTYKDGRICWGEITTLQDATPATLMPTLGLFLEGSLFNNHVANDKSIRRPGSILALYDDLVAEQADGYPLDDLLPVGASLVWLLSGGAWGGAR
jgi:PRTRC genetic system protein B